MLAGPLDGVRVLDLGQIVSGPFAAMMLADLGAEVIKVEPLGLGDAIRLSDFRRGGMTALYLNVNRGKDAIALDVGTDDGRNIVLDLAERADVVIQNMRPGVVDRLGIGYEACKARRADIVYCSITGYGNDGPWAQRPVLDPVIQGVTGIVARQKSEAIPIPDLVRMVIADKWTAQMASQGILAALFQRERTGTGQHVELSMLDAAIYVAWPDLMMDHTLVGEGVEGRFRIADVYQITHCADGQLIYFTASQHQRLGLLRALGRDDLCTDPRFNVTRMDAEGILALGQIAHDAFSRAKRDEILARLIEEQVPCGPILEPEEVIASEQLTANGTLVEWEHPTAGRVRQPRQPVHFSATPTGLPDRCPVQGEHTDRILTDLGRSADEIARLRASDVVA